MIRPAEFGLIARHFRPLAGAGSLDLADDAAVFAVPAGRELVVAADAMVETVHFLPGDPPETVGRKLLRANLSDLAAMGAEPFGYLLTVSVPVATPESWFASFAAGLALDQAEFGIALLGGDTTSTPGPISLSATVLGVVKPGCALRRDGARLGDGIWITGSIGDGALGLLASQGRVADPGGVLADRYRLPRPRLGLDLFGIASAAIDVSDGLVQDLGHLCTASGLAAIVEQDLVPLSGAAASAIRQDPGLMARCLTGGDDYEVLLAVPNAAEPTLRKRCAKAGTPITRIGSFVDGPADVIVRDTDREPVKLAAGGWSHF